MNDCVMTEVRDALPDLLHGRLSKLDTATMTAHVESCPACRAELALLRELRSSAPLAPSMDAARIASALPAYGGAAVMRNIPAPQKKSTWRFAVLAASAALAVALGGVALTNLRSSIDNTVPAVAAATSPLPASSSAGSVTLTPAPTTVASTEKSPTQVAAKAVEKQVASLSFVGGTQDLSEAELETLLAELDGMEPIPAAEPQSVTLSVDDIEGGT